MSNSKKKLFIRNLHQKAYRLVVAGWYIFTVDAMNGFWKLCHVFRKSVTHYLATAFLWHEVGNDWVSKVTVIFLNMNRAEMFWKYYRFNSYQTIVINWKYASVRWQVKKKKKIWAKSWKTRKNKENYQITV